MTVFEALPAGPFSIVLADPPWKHPGTNTGPNASPGAADYPIVSTKDLLTLPVADTLAKDALLFMWTVGPMVADAIRLGEAWCGRFITVAFVWDKQRTTVGFHTMPQTEFVFLFGRGRVLANRGTRNERQLVRCERGGHSRKPEIVQDAIDRMYPAAEKLELFARRARVGWTTWGNQIDVESIL